MNAVNPLLAVRALEVSASRQRVEAATTRANNVARILVTECRGISASVVGGSFAKGTARRDAASIDLFVALDGKLLRTRRNQAYKPSTVVRQLFGLLEETFEAAIQRGVVRLRRRTRSVHVVGPFRIGGADDVAVRVVPTLWDGNTSGAVHVPVHDTNRWALTSPGRQVELMQSYGRDITALFDTVRLANIWARKHRLAIRPFALEVLSLVAAHEGRLAADSAPGGLGTGLTVDGLLVRVFRLLMSVRVRRGLHLPGSPTPSQTLEERPSPMMILDPTVRDNNLTHYITAAQQQRIEQAARAAVSGVAQAQRAVESRDIDAARRAVRAVFG